MSQQQRLLQIPLAGALILGFLAALYLFFSPWFAKPEREPGVSSHSTGQSAEDVRKYWTAEKTRKARPAPMPHIDEKNDKGKAGPSRPPKA